MKDDTSIHCIISNEQLSCDTTDEIVDIIMVSLRSMVAVLAGLGEVVAQSGAGLRDPCKKTTSNSLSRH